MPERPTDDGTTTLNVELPGTLLDRLDHTCRASDPDSRDGSVRHTLCNAVEHPTLNRDGLVAFLSAETDTGEGATTSAQTVREQLGTTEH